MDFSWFPVSPFHGAARLWGAEAKIGIALMQHEAAEVATDAELLDPGGDAIRDGSREVWSWKLSQYNQIYIYMYIYIY